MKKLINNTLLLFLLCAVASLTAQDEGRIFVTNTDGSNVVRIKWVYPALYSTDASDVYRSDDDGSSWEKLNAAPIRKLNAVPLPDAQKTDMMKTLEPELNQGSPADKEGILQIMTAFELVESAPFATYLGLYFEDETALPGENYRYQIRSLRGGDERVLATSENIRVGADVEVLPPRDIDIFVDEEVDSLVKISWLPEETRYFGVNVYRTSERSGIRIKLNENLVIPGREIKPDGSSGYPDFFFNNDEHIIGENYTYELEAVDFFNRASKMSLPVTIEIPDRRPVPAPADVEAVKKNATEVWIVWSNADSENLAGYNVLTARKSDGKYKQLNDEMLPPDQTEFLYKVPEFGDYFFKIETVNRYGVTGESNPTGLGVYDIVPPAAVTGVTAASEAGKINLAWSANGEDDLVGYLVFRSVRADDTRPFVRLNSKALLTTNFTDELPPAARNRFYYKIAAIDTAYNISAFREVVGTVLPDVTPPETPVMSAADVTDAGVNLQWLTVYSEDMAGFEIFRAPVATPDTRVLLNTKLTAADAAGYTDTKAKPGTEYLYTVRAVDITGNVSGYSNAYRVRTKAPPKQYAGAEKLNINTNERKKRVQLKWKIETPDTIRGHVVFRKTARGTFAAVSPLLTGKTEYADTDIKAGRSYTYLVKTYYVEGGVGVSQEKKVKI